MSSVALVVWQRWSVGEHVLERPEHQRQRRAELVADVREERGLGAVELGQRLGAAALFFVGVCSTIASPTCPAATSRNDL